MTNSDRQSFLDRIRVSRQELNKITIITNQTLRITLKKRGRIRASASATLLKRCRRTKLNAVKQRKVSITAANRVTVSRIATRHSVKETNRMILQRKGTTVTTTEDTTADAESIV